MLTVQVREVQMRSAPTFTGKPSATLSYGQTVSVLEERGVWVRARASAGEGWVHQGVLTDKQLSLSSGADVSAKAGDREVAAAGKGFNAETERAYRQGRPEGYASVESMQRFQNSPADLNAFLAAGKVVPRKEAAQ